MKKHHEHGALMQGFAEAELSFTVVGFCCLVAWQQSQPLSAAQVSPKFAHADKCCRSLQVDYPWAVSAKLPAVASFGLPKGYL